MVHVSMPRIQAPRSLAGDATLLAFKIATSCHASDPCVEARHKNCPLFMSRAIAQERGFVLCIIVGAVHPVDSLQVDCAQDVLDKIGRRLARNERTGSKTRETSWLMRAY
jgi:hypothetical protein